MIGDKPFLKYIEADCLEFKEAWVKMIFHDSLNKQIKVKLGMTFELENITLLLESLSFQID